jgi:hypothetical protein
MGHILAVTELLHGTPSEDRWLSNIRAHLGCSVITHVASLLLHVTMEGQQPPGRRHNTRFINTRSSHSLNTEKIEIDFEMGI